MLFVAGLLLLEKGCIIVYEPGHEKMCLMSYANNKGADQPAHPRSLISAFVVRCLDSIMSLVSVTKMSSLILASVAAQASLSLTWSETPEYTFSHDEAHINICLLNIIVAYTCLVLFLFCNRNHFSCEERHFVLLEHTCTCVCVRCRSHS